MNKPGKAVPRTGYRMREYKTPAALRVAFERAEQHQPPMITLMSKQQDLLPAAVKKAKR